ncbi:PIN domain-containing protein [Auriculariales sp. MPI-PUGE-AT-0066]|nr:PIN domain-containing protein [Auriculariales sp. MPI-PUGE-AT-0066]
MDASFAALSEAMDIDATMDSNDATSRYLVFDTNVLISSLDVLVQVAQFVEERDVGLELLLPGIVIEELDRLKVKTGSLDSVTGRDVGTLARNASDFLLEHLRKRHRTGKGCVRGQAYRETLQSSSNWKHRVNKETNDELIIDCALYFTNRRPVHILTRDRNFAVMSLAQNIPTVVFEPNWNAVQVLAAVVPELQDSIYSSQHASDRVLRTSHFQPPPTQSHPTQSRQNRPPPTRQPFVNTTGDAIMIDDIPPPSTSTATNPHDAAHTELCTVALPLLVLRL